MAERFYLIDYDGINLFYNGAWTQLSYDSVEEGIRIIEYLEPLSDEEVEKWIRAEVLTDTNNPAWNKLKKVKS